MTNREKKIFNIAREVASFSDFKGPHIGAVVVVGKTIISTGYNSYRAFPFPCGKLPFVYENYKNSMPSQHAEMGALSHLIGKEIDWKKVSIFTYRELKNGEPACSRPCIACMTLIKDLGIKNIYFIDESGNYAKEKIL